ncbi:hypothetical protein K9M48_05140 [Candidatus Gracilibacteria bacterium]|nr:hypothetical protein [Candidatus Gracilibacteria bacterium]
MKNLVKFIQRYSTQLKYLGLIVFILSMIVAIRTYLNYIAILDAIGSVNQEIEKKTQEINHVENFLNKYLLSHYGDYFLSHENNILYKNEYILRLDISNSGNQEIIDEKQEVKEKILNAQDSRKDFIDKKIKNIK